MSVKVHEAFSIDSFQDRLLWWDDFLGDQLKDEWRSVSTGTTAVIDAQTGGIVRLLTGAVDTNAEYIDWANIRTLHIDKKVTMELRVKLGSTTSNEVYLSMWVGGAAGWVMFWKRVTNEWYIYCNNGAATQLDSGETADTDYHIFRVECFPTDEVHFYIDRVETANSPITTNIPNDAGDYLEPYLWLRTHENVAKSMDIDYVVVRQEI